MIDIHYSGNFTPDIIVPDDYTTIQEAIDAAYVNDTIFVLENVVPYKEKLFINKTIKLMGENPKTTIINASGIANGSKAVVHITADNVKMSGFTVTDGIYGVSLENTVGTTIRDNIIKENYIFGIYSNHSNESVIDNNIIDNNFQFGIYLNFSYKTHVIRNKVLANMHYGIYLNRCYETIVGGNEILENKDYGIYLDSTINDTINNNIISENKNCGICLDNTTNTTLKYNVISYNYSDSETRGLGFVIQKGFGVLFYNSHVKSMVFNTISHNRVGAKIINTIIMDCLNWNTFMWNEMAIDYDPEPLEIDSNVFINNTIAIKVSGDDSLLTITNNTINGSEIGIYVETGSPIIDGNTFTDNDYGIYYLGGSNPVITNNTFTDNVVDIYSIVLATLDVDPNTLNLKSKGKWVTAYITLPEGMEASDIEFDTISLGDGTFEVGGDYGELDSNECMAKFDRSELEDQIGGPNEALELTLKGELSDGTPLTGSDAIRVIRPGN
jgi:parallel beta-helix repeat protein